MSSRARMCSLTRMCALTNKDEQRWIQQLQSEWDFVIIREMIDEKRASVLGTHAAKVLYTVS